MNEKLNKKAAEACGAKLSPGKASWIFPNDDFIVTAEWLDAKKIRNQIVEHIIPEIERRGLQAQMIDWIIFNTDGQGLTEEMWNLFTAPPELIVQAFCEVCE
jgi:hypothetical protein